MLTNSARLNSEACIVVSGKIEARLLGLPKWMEVGIYEWPGPVVVQLALGQDRRVLSRWSPGG